jgi:hypothetical protein
VVAAGDVARTRAKFRRPPIRKTRPACLIADSKAGQFGVKVCNSFNVIPIQVILRDEIRLHWKNSCGTSKSLLDK